MAADFDTANAVTTDHSTATTSPSVNYPTLAEGERLVVVGSSLADVTAPSGSVTWNEISGSPFTNGSVELHAFWADMPASPPTSETWTVAASRKSDWVAIELTGSHATTPVDSAGTKNTGTSTQASHGGGTPTVDDCVALYIHAVQSGSNSGITVPSGHTEFADIGASGGASSSLYASKEARSDTTATGTITPGSHSSSANWVATTIIFKPVAASTQTITLPSPLTPVTILAPTVANDTAETITLPAPLSPVTILAPTIANDSPETITLPAPLTPVTIFAPTVANASPGAQTITLPAPLSPVTILAPTVASQAAETITLPVALSPVTILAPAVAAQSADTITLPAPLTPVTILAPTVTLVTIQTIVLPLLSPVTIFAPTISGGITAPTIVAPTTLAFETSGISYIEHATSGISTLTIETTGTTLS